MKKTVKNKKNNKAWFVHVRKSYLPASWQGLSIYFLYVAYLVLVPVVWYRNGHDLWKLLTTVIPLVIGMAIVTQFVAYKNSK
jgi:hypothetical protein